MEPHPQHNADKFTAGTHIPFWINSTPLLSFQKLQLDKEVDVVIVGGGIAGVSVAYNLSLAGKKVAIVEDGFIGSGETGRTSAHLVSALDDRYYNLVRIYGEDHAALIAESHMSAIDFIERTVNKEKIDCDFERVNGYLFLHPSDKPENMTREYETLKKLGLDVEQADILLGDRSQRAIKFNNQAQFHPLNYLKGLCEAIQKNGGDIYTNTHAREINSQGIVSNEGFWIKAKHVVVATNSPVNNKYVMHLKQYPHRTYMIGLLVKKDSLPHALWWDSGDHSISSEIPPYHYVRLQKYNSNYDLLLVGGEDHPVGLAELDHKPEEKRYQQLESWARAHFNGLGKITYQWSGQVMEPMDSLAFIGHNPMDADNIYIVTGDSGNGLTHGSIAAMLIKDMILGKTHRWEKIYSPSRFKLFKAGKTFFKEFVGGFINYLKTQPSYSDETGLKELKRNDGKIIEFEGKKFGVYRDEDDNLHFIDSECTHLGCGVRWNNDEKSWDCPCHGSRFSYEGQVLNGPANEPLSYYTQTKHSVHNI